MKFRMHPPVTALGLLLAGAALSAPLAASSPLPEYPANLKALTQQEATRAQAALAYLNANLNWSAEQLTADDSFRILHTLTNTQGECVVRFQQYHKRKLVYGSSVVVKVAPDGSCTLMPDKALRPTRGTVTPSTATLSTEEVLKVMTGKIAPKTGFARTPSVALGYFPASATGELAMALDPATQLIRPNPLEGGEGYRPQGDLVLAYEIRAELLSGDPKIPNVELTAMVDATTGAILNRSTGGLQRVNPFQFATGTQLTYGQRPLSPSALLQDAAARTLATTTSTTIDVPAGTPTQTLTPKVGIGYTTYSGQVFLPTTYDPVLKGYGLLDTTRGGANNYFVQQYMGSTDSYGNYTPNLLRPAGNLVIAGGGLGAWIPYTMDGISGSLFPIPGVAADAAGTGIGLVTGLPNTSKTGDFSTADKDNVWGDSYMLEANNYDRAHSYGAYSTEGRTAAAEAMNFMTCSYEFLKTVFNRKGLDNRDSAMTVMVNYPYWGNSIYSRSSINVDYDADGNANSVGTFMLQCGVGDFPNNIANAAEPTMLGWYTGLMLYQYLLPDSLSVWTRYDMNPLAIGWSALMSQGMYSLGARYGVNHRVLLPTWNLGNWYLDGRYDFDLAKPSLDQISSDSYYDGITFLYGGAGGYCAGPINRAYYFMSEGASASEGAKTYSKYLPEGMVGIGIEKTTKIAYKAITERVANRGLTVFQMRDALMKAAVDLYGEGSEEVQATANAWAAVNIGPAWGKPEPVRIWMDAANWPDDSPAGLNGPDVNTRAQRYFWAPIGDSVQLRARVSGTTDTSVTWSNDPTPMNVSGLYNLNTTINGSITPEGLFTPPLRHPTGVSFPCSVQVASKADPKQFSQGIAFGFLFDCDGDANNDALDLGMVALAYGLPLATVTSANEHIMPGYPDISEPELQMWLATFQTAFCQ